jgi:hypothetical protein
MSFQVDPLLKDFIQLEGSHCTVGWFSSRVKLRWSSDGVVLYLRISKAHRCALPSWKPKGAKDDDDAEAEIRGN